MNTGNIFIFGVPRSGTTWLAKIFDSHPATLLRHEPDTVNPTAAIPFIMSEEEIDQYLTEARDYLHERTTDTQLRCVSSSMSHCSPEPTNTNGSLEAMSSSCATLRSISLITPIPLSATYRPANRMTIDLSDNPKDFLGENIEPGLSSARSRMRLAAARGAVARLAAPSPGATEGSAQGARTDTSSRARRASGAWSETAR